MEPVSDPQALPANVLLVARLTVLALFLQGGILELAEPHVPLFPGLYSVPLPGLVRAGYWILSSVGAALLFGRWPRVGAALVAAVLVAGPLLDIASYRNSLFYAGCLLVLTALWDEGWGLRPLRAQVLLLYAGATLHKLFTLDWMDGTYFEHWQRVILGHDWYGRIADAFPPGVLSTSLGWITIAGEAGILVGLARPPWRRSAILFAIGFHGASVLIAGTTFGIFVPVVLASFLYFEEKPLGRPALAWLAMVVLCLPGFAQNWLGF